MTKFIELIRQRIKDPSQLKQALSILILLIIWCFFLWRALNNFGPSNDVVLIPYHSDAAIPVLMSNDERPVTVFNLYYYAADRWGGWPFLLAQFVRRATGYRWSDQSLFTMQAIWIFIGLLVLASLSSRRDRLMSVLIYLIPLCLHWRIRYWLFSLSQVYAWQLTALLLGWYSLRRFFESHLENSTDKTPLRKDVVWGFLTLWFSYFAIWSSPASVLFLFFLLSVEASRVYLKTEGAREGGRFRRGYIWGAGLVILAAVAEFLQKTNYHRYSLKHFGNEYRTDFALDTGYLAQNLKRHLHELGQLSWWPLYLLPALVLLALGGAYLCLSLQKRDDLLKRLRAILLNDTAILSVATYGIAIINFVLVVIVNHVRLNNYDDRFLVLTFLFAPISSLLMLFMMFDLIAQSFNLRAYLRPALITAGIIFLTLNFPAQGYSPLYKTMKETALALNQKAPRGVLMGGYWQTYVFASLQTTDALTPVPVEGQSYRTPWTPERIKLVDQVVVEYRSSKLGDAQGPPAHLEQYGNSLRLIEAKWYENGEYAFALYLNETRQNLRP